MRTFKTPEDFAKRLGEDWYVKGQNHRKVRGGIARDFPDEAWFVEIDSLDALLRFHEKHGNLVLGGGWYDSAEKYPQIEIYDGYRE